MYAPESANSRRPAGELGFLRFEESWEKEFVRFFAARDLPLVRAALTAGLIFVAIRLIMDANLNSREIDSASVAIRLSLIAALSLSLLGTISRVLAGNVSRLLLCTGVALSAGSVGLVLLSVTDATDLDFSDTAASIVLINLALGLRFYIALGLTLPIMLALLWSQVAGVELGEISISQVASIILISLLAVLTCYRIERNERILFCERKRADDVRRDDVVTGVANERTFNTHLYGVRRLAQREERGMAVAFIEVDYLEEFQNRYGQRARDLCMRRVAQAIARSGRRPLDFVGRLTEDQFALVLYDPDQHCLERIFGLVRGEVAMLDIPHASSPASERVTVSIGVAMSPAGTRHRLRNLLEVAAETLQEAIGQGRDRVMVRDSLSTDSESKVLKGPW